MEPVVSAEYSQGNLEASESPKVSSKSRIPTGTRYQNKSNRHGLGTRFSISVDPKGSNGCSNENFRGVGYVSNGWNPGYREPVRFEDVVTELRKARKAAHCILAEKSLPMISSHKHYTGQEAARVFARLACSKSNRIAGGDQSLSVPIIQLKEKALSHQERDGRLLAEPRTFETRFRRHIERLYSGADDIPGDLVPESAPVLAVGVPRQSRALISFHAYKQRQSNMKNSLGSRKKNRIAMALRNSIRRVCDNLQALIQVVNTDTREHTVSRIKDTLIQAIKPLRFGPFQETASLNTSTSLESELEKVLHIVKRVPPSRSLLLSLCKIQKVVEHTSDIHPP